MKKEKLIYKLKSNKAKKHYTIRVYHRGKCITTYRTNPQGSDFIEQEHWTQEDIKNFLQHSQDYFEVK